MDLAAVEKVFATTEQGVCPWDILKETVYEGSVGIELVDNSADRNYSNAGGISIENWVGLWNKYFHNDAKAAFRDLVYIGFCG
mmetsp:Transcript_42022/g.55367  ORF Transcript_42022/g.55367 Transcript_42022/m.55367 type:complete len:83 (+) Transcript_42022:990-1238(+)|eukprot:CAMPEP_0185592912 /NCGR_PEP_ID=MMETSP0434-20130131/69656_1 /TAXON_ID=626734 ORGANISM="Favella taraikaensis, Strain Fe Narragansett Bay" /NCGR_SAMPLE_ID=MMETSP0434 /ASSEMBLY_ACC=CAM_ASM_000379 /LENGTH=82 /DNA_ID=CAMNT_0028219099 /DNA_START=953 /DNA_END=1201 /DNA_ORIENTATION=-